MKAEPTRKGTHKFYKGEYLIVFYDKTDTQLLYVFDNVREILRFQEKELSRQNINLINVELYRALKSKEHFTRFLTGEVLRVYIINRKDNDEDVEIYER